MWEITFWIDGVQTGESLMTYTLDDQSKFIEGIVWGLKNVMKANAEIRINYKESF